MASRSVPRPIDIFNKFQLVRIQTNAAVVGRALIADWQPITAQSPSTAKFARLYIISDGSAGESYTFPLTPFLCSPDMQPQSQNVQTIPGSSSIYDTSGLVDPRYLGVQIADRGASTLIYKDDIFGRGILVPPTWFIRLTSRGGLPLGNEQQTVQILYTLESIP